MIKATAEFFLNDTKDVDFSASTNGNIKFLSPLSNNNGSDYGDLYTDQNFTDNEPKIPEYITLTSMIFCIIIMCLGLIGNIMVKMIKIRIFH